MSLDIVNKYQIIRKKLKKDYYSDEPGFEYIIASVDNYINNPNVSELEKAFYLLLNRFPGTNNKYITIPNEKILIDNIFDFVPPCFEYEIDFAIYGGVISSPIKIAIECDGIRSHGEKHFKKDRRKSINLQAAGWFLISINSRELHEEINKYISQENYISELLGNIENVIESRLYLLDYHKYNQNEINKKLTGYTWDSIHCPNCNKYIRIKLNYKYVVCPLCNHHFERDRKNDPELKWEYNQLLYF